MDIVVHNAEHSIIGDEEVFVLTTTVTRDDGTSRQVVDFMPADIFESRAAEYDIDPTTDQGWDDVLNMVLYENYTGESAEEQLTSPNHLLNAPTIGQARTDRMNRVRAKRGKGVLRGEIGKPTARTVVANARMIDTSGDTQDPLVFIRQKAPISEEHMKIKREFTRRRRNAIRVKRQGRSTTEMVDADSLGQVPTPKPTTERKSPEQLASWLLGSPVVDPRNPSRNAPK